MTAGWSVLAPEQPDKYPPGAWSKLDAVVAGARERGLKVMIDVAFWAPRWAVGRGGGNPERERTDIEPAAFGRFARAVAARYPDAEGFTVWNEPNFDVFFLPQWSRAGAPLSPHRYREMVHAAVPALKAEAPRAVVLVGATAAVGASRDPATPSDRMAPLAFLRALACVDESLRPLRSGPCRDFRPVPGDGWSHHPYSLGAPPGEPDPSPDNVRLADLPRLVSALRALRARFENPLDVWITEYGYETNPPDPTRATSPEEQARWLPEAYALARSTPGVRSFAQFLVADMPERPGASERERWGDYQMGLWTLDGERKPAWETLRAALRERP